MAPRVDLEEIRTAHLLRINDIADCRDNRDTLDAENAARNLMASKPAYWHFGRTNAASYIGYDANRTGSLTSALVAFLEGHKGEKWDVEDILDAMIPLNDEAVAELELCYRMQAAFRDDIRQREEHAIMEPLRPRPRLIHPEHEAARDDFYAVRQRRFLERQRDAHWNRPVGKGRKLDAVALAGAVAS